MDNRELYETLVAKMESMDKRINKRLDSIGRQLSEIKYELKKIDTVLSYTEHYDNIPT